MKRLAVIFTLLILPAMPVVALDPPHDATNSISCPACHTANASSAADLSTPEGQVNVCRSCHNPAGATDSENHKHDGAPDTICTTCHNQHKQEQAANGSVYGKYVQTTIQTPNSGAKTVIFKGVTGTNSFADGDSTYDGICEVCHTTTLYHRNNSSGDHLHHKGQNCMDCHQHTAGFKPSKGCLDCHNQAQGAGDYRRQVVDGPAGPGDFSRRSHHAYTGAAQSVTEADCRTCHDWSLHRTYSDGVSVLLKNQDGGASYTYTGSGSSIEPFCLGCHDTNAAGGNTHPLSDGQTPTDIAQGTRWSSSLHKTRGLTCFGTGTTGCHSNGHGSKKRSHLAPEGVAPSSDYHEEEEGICLTCHGAAGPGRNIATQLTKTRDHMIDSSSLAGRHKPDEPLVGATYSGSNRHVECADCHNQHWLPSGGLHTIGSNVASDVLKYVTRVQATYGLAGVPPTFTPRAPGDTVPPPREYEICFKCHSSWAYGATPPNTPEGTQETDTSVDFNMYNKSFHPVVGYITNNSYTIPTTTNGSVQTMVAPWNTTSHKHMYCTDCHTGESPSDPNGPHGSAYNYLLPTNDTEKGLCLICHNASVYNPSTDPLTAETGSRFDYQTSTKSRASHYYHVTTKGIKCRQCHGGVRTLGTRTIETGSAHGTNTVNGLLNGRDINAYSPGSCTPSCHSNKTYTAGAE